MDDLQLLLRFDNFTSSIHVVCSVPADDGAWELIYDEHFHSSKAPSVLSLLVKLWTTMKAEASASGAPT